MNSLTGNHANQINGENQNDANKLIVRMVKTPRQRKYIIHTQKNGDNEKIYTIFRFLTKTYDLIVIMDSGKPKYFLLSFTATK